MLRRPRVIFFGIRCRMSLVPLVSLVERGVEIRAVVVPATRVHGRPVSPISSAVPRMSRAFLPLAVPGKSETIDQVAARHGIPVFQAGSLRHPMTIDTLRTLEADVIAVSCFPRRLPPSLLGIAPLGALNLHPSLLPAYRGPDPLFWIFRDGGRKAGVTVHLITADLDAGDNESQRAIELPDGIGGDALEAQCAEIGGELLAEAVWSLRQGTARRTPQDEREATYQPWPSPSDMVIDPGWTARRAFNFTRGVIPLGYRPTIETGTGRFVVSGAIGFDEHAVLGEPSVIDGHDLAVQCDPGVLYLTVSESGEAGG
jgi:methionyl-tRNA formyltransferase